MQLVVFGDRRTALPPGWTSEVVVSVVGDLDIDATATPGPGARLRVVSLVGDTTVRVPAAARVVGGGATLVGERSDDGSGDGPELRIDAYTLLGDVSIRAQR